MPRMIASVRKQKREKRKRRWTKPAWMAPYIPMLKNTGGAFDDPATAMNCDGKYCNLVVDGPRALLCIAVRSQVLLLESLHEKGLLR